MIDPIVAYPSISPLVRLDLASLAPVSLPQVSAADQARFQEALRPSLDTLAAVTPKTPSAEIRVERALTPGDAILQSLDNMRNGYRNLTIDIESAIGQIELSPQALISLQMQVSQVTLNTQLVNQIANKIEQDMNSLLKSS
ncbi:MAG TPA: hypothetical protein DCS21_05385 [Gammaproteobacteria bacterium]|nr:hypothetical protein [Gammaproteobacteria bacterium]